MTGTEFLREMRKLHPDAKRALLTAYADSEAAIAAINEVGLDHYLMKPWDPPEQRLYPVLDDLLARLVGARRGRRSRACASIGSRWSPRSYDTRDFLSRNQIPYQWIDIEQDAAMRELAFVRQRRRPGAAAGRAAARRHHADDAVARRAGRARCGLQTAPTRPFYDLAIIGAGPAGLACAVYGASEGLKVVLIEQNAPGGQAGTSSMIENYLGFPNGVTGADLARRAATQAKRFGTELLVGHSVVGLKRVDPYKVVQLSNGEEVACHALLLSSGMSVRELDVPGHRAAHRRGRLLRRGAVGGGDVPRPARVRAGRRELGGAGRAVLRPLRRRRSR